VRHDLAVIGSGAAAFSAASAARRRNKSVVMIERETIGGRCVNTGCVPSKALLAAAQARQIAGNQSFPDILTETGAVEFAALIQVKRALVERIRADKYIDLAAHSGWQIIRGIAGFVDGPCTPRPKPRPASVSARGMTSRLVDCWHELGERRGLLLVQLPPDQERDDDRLDYFLRGLPEWMGVAVELRHHSWAVDPVFDPVEPPPRNLRGDEWRRPASCSASHLDNGYVRLHGPDHDHLYAGSYGDADLHWWADRIRGWHRQHLDVFAYFNNDGYGHAVTNARRLRTLTNS
jgi:hypothetical protein